MPEKTRGKRTTSSANAIPAIRRNWLSALAESIAQRYFVDGAFLELGRIAEEYNITYSIGDYGLCYDGLIEYRAGEGFHIYLEQGQSERRSRFSFAHELGHYFIDEHANALSSGLAPAHSSFTNFAGEYRVESEADFFAACLLMPRNLILRDYRRHRSFSWTIVNNISKNYNVSSLAVIFRLRYLNLHPMIIIKAIQGKIKQYWKVNDFYYFFDSANGVPEDTLMWRYFNEGFKADRTEQLWAPDWFSTTKEAHIFERCIYYDNVATCYSIIWIN